MSEFKKGDVVQLKSGGPKMTIGYLLTDDTNRVKCTWFDGKTVKEETFYTEQLKTPTPPTVHFL